jgi:hypothetical protein
VDIPENLPPRRSADKRVYHCCDREPLQATLKTFGTVPALVSRQNVVPRFANAGTVHNGTIEVAGSGQAMAPEGCGVGSGGHGGGHGCGQAGAGTGDWGRTGGWRCGRQ